MIVSIPQDMPTTPSILKSTALTEASHNANKKFSSRNYYYKNYYKKKLHPNNFKNTSANTKPKKIMTSFQGEGSRVLTGLMVEKEMTAAADSGVHELHHFNI